MTDEPLKTLNEMDWQYGPMVSELRAEAIRWHKDEKALYKFCYAGEGDEAGICSIRAWIEHVFNLTEEDLR